MANPFEIRSAELMDLKQLASEFVKDHTEYAKIASHSHTIVWGSRGSGKSMHFRFLEPIAQACSSRNTVTVESLLAEKGSFVGIFINCREGVLNRDELRLVQNLPNANAQLLRLLFGRYMCCVIVKRICDTLTEQTPHLATVHVPIREVPLWVQRVIRTDSKNVSDLLISLRVKVDTWLLQLGDLVDQHYLQQDRAPDTSGFPSESPRLTTDLYELCGFLQRACSFSGPFFLLFDEANELSPLQQQCVNSLIAQRSQNRLCIKVASQRNSFLVGKSLEGPVDETHDYTSLDLDGLYTGNRDAYYNRMRLIANDRLKRSDIAATIEEYIPEGSRAIEEREKARMIAEQRYDALPEDRRPFDKANFVKKYAPAILFQQVISPKGGQSYTGFGNVVHLSSGIVRSFLDCCARMYERCKESNPDSEPDNIPISVQETVITEYSDQFIESQILEKRKNLAINSPEWMKLGYLHNLLLALGVFFRARLLDKESREPRIISISLKDEPSPELQAVLDLAEREAFLHRRWYRSKRGNRNLVCYVLNRRLCPHFNLDLTGFQGRVEVNSADLQAALSRPEALAARMRKEAPDETHEDSRQLILFDW